MKMNQLAAAVALCLPLAGAYAQQANGVTVYGLLDAAATWGDAGGSASSEKRLDSGVGPGSRLGFRGNEDLGGGLRAFFTMEMGFDSGTGTLQQGNLTWGRQVFLGLGGKDWSLSFGRQYTPTSLAMIAADAMAQHYWGSSAGYGNGSLQSPNASQTNSPGCLGSTLRVNNSALGTYTAGALTARLMVAAGDETDNGSGRYVNPSLTYSSGPLTLAASYARLRQCNADILAGSSPEWQTEATAGGAYDFGPVKLFAGHYLWNPSERNKALTATTVRKHNATWVGMRMPLGASGTLIAQVARQKQDLESTDAKGTSLGLTYEHLLSKRTKLYVSGARLWNDDAGRFSLVGATAMQRPSGAGEDPRTLSVGMTHLF